PMHESDRTERRLADRRTDERQPGRVRERESPHRRELHEEIVRMLMVDDRLAVERLARLEELTGALAADGRGLDAGHAWPRKAPLRRIAARHPHPPVRHGELGAAALAALMVELGEHHAVLHERPTGRRHRHLRVIVRRGVLRARGNGDQQYACRNRSRQQAAYTHHVLPPMKVGRVSPEGPTYTRRGREWWVRPPSEGGGDSQPMNGSIGGS